MAVATKSKYRPRTKSQTTDTIPFQIIEKDNALVFTAPTSFISKEALEDMIEEYEAMQPAFQAKLEASRKSGKPISAHTIERKLGII
jgi:hypothetical protein